MSVGVITRKALPFSNVVANQQATSQITVGRTLNAIELQLGGTFAKSDITMFRLKANGKTIYEGSGSQIDAINKYRGLADDPAFLDIFFEDLTGLDQLDRSIGNLDTSIGIANLTTEVDIGAAINPSLQARLIESAPQRDSSGAVVPFAGLIAKQLRYGFSVASGGELPLNFPFGPQNGAVIKRVHVFHSGNMTAAVVKEDGIIKHESSKAANEYMQRKHGRVPQPNVYTIDFVVDGNVRNAFDTRTAKSVEWLFTFSNADSGYVVIEYLDTLGNL